MSGDGAARRPAVAVSRTTRSFVGRGPELAALGAAFDDVLGARSVAVLVSGDAGIGKSRLIEEFLDIARLRDAAVAVGRCVPGDAGLPYAPVVGILRDLSGRVPEAGDLLGFAAGELRVEAADPSGFLAAISQVGGGYGRTAFFESVLQVLVELGQATPIVLAVEDVHWCDSASAQLLDYLVRNLGATRLLLICTYRAEEFGPDNPLTGWLAELGRSPRAIQLAVGGLDQREVAALLAEAAGSAVPADLVESVWTRSQGNPFYAEELWAAGSAAHLPAALQTLILLRVRRLSARCQQLLGVAATIGATSYHDLLAAVAASPAEAFDADLTEAIDSGVLAVELDGSGYRFRHVLLREAIYAALLPARRQALHQRIVDALHSDPSLCARTPGYRLAMLAGHAWEAGDYAAVVAPAIEAAEAAAAVFAFREAELHIGRAMTALDRLSPGDAVQPVDRQVLLERAGEYAYSAGSNQRAVDLAQAGIALARGAGDAPAEARCQLLLARSAREVGDSAQAFAAARAALALQPADTATPQLAQAMAEEARCYLMTSQRGAAEARAREAIAVADGVGARAVAASARCTLGLCVSAEGQVEEGIELVRAALEVAEDLVLPDDLNRAYCNLGYLLYSADRLEEAAGVVFDGMAMGEEIGGVRLSAAATNSIEALIRLGRWDDADYMVRELGLASYGSCAMDPYLLPLPIATGRGSYADADDLVRTAHVVSSGIGDPLTSALVHGQEALLEVERGRPVRAVDAVREAVRLIVGTDDEVYLPQFCAIGIRASVDLTDLSIGGSPEDAATAVRDAGEFLETAEAALNRLRAGGATIPPYPAALMLLCRAEFSRASRSDSHLWREAGDGFVASPDAYLAAYCKWREAEALLEMRGSRARARECLSDAAQRSAALHTAPLTARIEELAARTRIELEAPPATATDTRSNPAAELGLTAREAEILGQLTAGCTDQEIAQALFISKKTVRVHVTSVLRKLHVTNRVEAGRIGQRLGVRATPVG